MGPRTVFEGSRLPKGMRFALAPVWDECLRYCLVVRNELPGPQLGETSMSYFKRLRQFVVSEDGPTAVEYAVMLALIIVVCLVAIQTLGTNTSTTFTNIGNSLAS